MSSLHKIKGRDILNDLRSGMTDQELMEKYEMSSQALGSACDQLCSSGLISEKELLSRSTEKDEGDTVTSRLPRDYLVVQAPIYDVRDPETRGVIRDLTEEGIGIIGLKASLDDNSRGVDKIVFGAKCRWVKKDSEGGYVCGFRITDITEENLEKLRRLIRELNWGG
jgi:hypothetical protein